uniref:Uncharacterized protein n=1 Tax=Hubei odonate virus 14 TaxID=1922995 RepID=A0A1L3KPC6_9VIRU|nr:hypothetical protein [Hubei odonate virus 14]
MTNRLISKVDELERRLMYYITSGTDTLRDSAALKWLEENQNGLQKWIETDKILTQNGITVKDLNAQLKFGKEYQALTDYVNYYNSWVQNRNNVISIGTYYYQGKRLKNHLNLLKKIDESNQTRKIIDGYNHYLYLIPFKTQVINTTGTNVYYDASNESVAISIINEGTSLLMTITYGSQKWKMSIDNPHITDAFYTRNIVMKSMLLMRVDVMEDQTVKLQGITAVMSLEERKIELKLSGSIVLPSEVVDIINFDLPPELVLIKNILTEEFDESYDALKTMYIMSIIRQVIPQASEFYHSEIGTGLSAGLYGQGSVVAISKIYSIINSTVITRDKTYTIAQQMVKNGSYQETIQYSDEMTYKVPVTQDSIVTSLNYQAYFWLKSLTPSIVLGEYKNDTISVTTDIAKERLEYNKGVSESYTDTDKQNSDYWIEKRIVNFRSPKRKDTRSKCYNAKTGLEIGAAVDFVGNVVDTTTWNLYGLLVRVKDEGGVEDVYIRTEVDVQADYDVEYWMYIMPNNMASDSNNQMDYNGTITIGSDDFDITGKLTPTTILYGDGQKTGYVGKIYTKYGLKTITYVSDVPFYQSNYDGLHYDANFGGGKLYADKANYKLDIDAGTRLKIGSCTVYATDNKLYLGGTNLGTMTLYSDINGRYSYDIPVTPPFNIPYIGDKFEQKVKAYYCNLTNVIVSNVPKYLDIDTTNTIIEVKNNTTTSTMMLPDYASETISLPTGKARLFTYPLSLQAIPSTSLSKIWGATTSVRIDQADANIKSFNGTASELTLPDGVTAQSSIPEAIANLQTGLNLLSNYAEYLRYMINNLNERLIYINRTLEEISNTINVIIDAINGSAEQQQSGLGIASQIIGFIGAAVGMFFPLCGLAITTLSTVLTGINEIQEGNVLVGVFDVTIGLLMGGLFGYKLNQRFNRKYGAQEINTDDASLINYEAVIAPPGYSSIDMGASRLPSYSEVIKNGTKGGIIKNSTYEYDKVVEELKLVTSVKSEEMDKIAEWLQLTDRMRNSSGKDAVVFATLTEVYSKNGNRKSMEFDLVTVTADKNGNTTRESISDESFNELFENVVTKDTFVKSLVSYSLTERPVSNGMFFDDDVFAMMFLSNLKQVDDVATNEKRDNDKPNKQIQIQDNTITHIRKRNLNVLVNRTYLSVSDIASAFLPNKNDVGMQNEIINNISRYIL